VPTVQLRLNVDIDHMEHAQICHRDPTTSHSAATQCGPPSACREEAKVPSSPGAESPSGSAASSPVPPGAERPSRTRQARANWGSVSPVGGWLAPGTKPPHRQGFVRLTRPGSAAASITSRGASGVRSTDGAWPGAIDGDGGRSGTPTTGRPAALADASQTPVENGSSVRPDGASPTNLRPIEITPVTGRVGTDRANVAGHGTRSSRSRSCGLTARLRVLLPASIERPPSRRCPLGPARPRPEGLSTLGTGPTGNPLWCCTNRAEGPRRLGTQVTGGLAYDLLELQRRRVSSFRQASGGITPGCCSAVTGAIVRDKCSGPHEVEAPKASLSVRLSVRRLHGVAGYN